VILDVDMGNSRFKWRLRQGQAVVVEGCIDNNRIDDYAAVFSCLPARPEGILLASVVSDRELLFSQWCQHYWQLAPVSVKVSRYCAGVTNGYSDVAQMGVDRWLAMLSAYNESKSACLVVDSGSACTVDLLLADGRHFGGYITPGLTLMKDALFRDTDRVKLPVIRYDGDPIPGRTTQDAVASGLRLMQEGLVFLAFNQLLNAGAIQPQVFFSGGGGAVLARLFESQLAHQSLLDQVGSICIRPSLVLDGLLVAMSCGDGLDS
jgi:type III pantothenate kinase